AVLCLWGLCLWPKPSLVLPFFLRLPHYKTTQSEFCWDQALHPKMLPGSQKSFLPVHTKTLRPPWPDGSIALKITQSFDGRSVLTGFRRLPFPYLVHEKHSVYPYTGFSTLLFPL